MLFLEGESFDLCGGRPSFEKRRQKGGTPLRWRVSFVLLSRNKSTKNSPTQQAGWLNTHHIENRIHIEFPPTSRLCRGWLTTLIWLSASHHCRDTNKIFGKSHNGQNGNFPASYTKSKPRLADYDGGANRKL